MVPGANSPRSKGQDCSANSICDDKEDIVNPFCGDDNLPLRTSRKFSERGFYNPDGKSCSVIAALALLQYIKPLMDLVASKKGALCQKLHEIYQLRGLKDESILKPLDELRTLLGFPTDEDMDANEFMYTLLGQILKDEDLIGQIFSGKLKEKMTLDSSSTGEVTLEQVSDIPGNDADGESPVYSIGLTKTSNDITVRDLLSKKLSETRSAIPFNEWNDEWKKKYPEGEADAECHKMNYFDPAPQVTILALERGTGSTDKKGNRPVKIPNIIPEADFTHPEDECIHSMHSGGGGSLFLFGMIMYSEVRNHYYSMVGVNDTSWIVHGDLSTYQLDMTDDLLKDLGGKDRKDSSKPPLLYHYFPQKGTSKS